MKKNITILFTALLISSAFLLFSSCGKSDPKEFAQKFMDAERKAWIEGDISDLEKLEAPDVVYILPDVEVKGWEAHKNYILEGRKKGGNQNQNWKYIMGEGNIFVMLYESRYNEKNGSEYVEQSMFTFRLEKGRVAEVWISEFKKSSPDQKKK